MTKKILHSNRAFKPGVNEPDADIRHAYAYDAIVKDTADYQRAGRIRAWVPDLGGADADENDEQHWRLFQYCSVFGGTSPADPRRLGLDWPKTPTAYGLWMIPPDVGNRIAVMFLNGDSNRGIWFGCLGAQFMNHSLPDIASADAKPLGAPNARPVTEYSKHDWAVADPFNPGPREEHRERMQALVASGLAADHVRGHTTSSAQRESPSQVFGILTPGPVDAAIPNAAQAQIRHGGHSFTLDDGDAAGGGANELIRLRTRTGHQILMHDSAGVVYIGGRGGRTWMEFDVNSGQVNVFGGGNVSVRAGGDLNLHADRNVNIGADGDFNLNVGGSTRMTQAGDLDLSTGGDRRESTAGTAHNSAAEMRFRVDGNMNLRAAGKVAIKSESKFEVAGNAVRLHSTSSTAITSSLTTEITSTLVSFNPLLSSATTTGAPAVAAPARKTILSNHRDVRDPKEALAPGSYSGVKSSPASVLPTMEPFPGHAKISGPPPSNRTPPPDPSQPGSASAPLAAPAVLTENSQGASFEGDIPPKAGAISAAESANALPYEDFTGKWIAEGYSGDTPNYKRVGNSFAFESIEPIDSAIGASKAAIELADRGPFPEGTPVTRFTPDIKVPVPPAAQEVLALQKFADSLDPTDRSYFRWPVSDLDISENGIAFLKRWEGANHPVPYFDIAGVKTIGAGHAYLSSELKSGKINIGGREVEPPLSEADIDELLKQDLRRFVKAVRDSCGDAKISQNQADALIVMCYNIGPHGFATSTVARLVREGDIKNVPAAMMLWTKATIGGSKRTVQGLVNRRAAEAELFTTFSKEVPLDGKMQEITDKVGEAVATVQDAAQVPGKVAEAAVQVATDVATEALSSAAQTAAAKIGTERAALETRLRTGAV